MLDYTLIKALHEMGLKVCLFSSAYPERDKTLSRIGIDVTQSIDGFVMATNRNEMVPFLGIYQRMVDYYFSLRNWINKISFYNRRRNHYA